METKNGVKAFYAPTRSAWRNWLTKNHVKEKSVWLIIFHKGSETKSVVYDEAVEEALCFGWIDSKPNKRDDESYYLFFAQRKPSSNWSRANRERAEKMIASRRMTKAGQAMIDLAKKTGKWEALEKVQMNVVPDDLALALKKSKAAQTNFEGFPPSSKRIILEWILNAKKAETRKKRIEETVSLAAKNIKANHYRQ